MLGSLPECPNGNAVPLFWGSSSQRSSSRCPYAVRGRGGAWLFDLVCPGRPIDLEVDGLSDGALRPGPKLLAKLPDVEAAFEDVCREGAYEVGGFN